MKLTVLLLNISPTSLQYFAFITKPNASKRITPSQEKSKEISIKEDAVMSKRKTSKLPINTGKCKSKSPLLPGKPLPWTMIFLHGPGDLQSGTCLSTRLTINIPWWSWHCWSLRGNLRLLIPLIRVRHPALIPWKMERMCIQDFSLTPSPSFSNLTLGSLLFAFEKK